MKLFYIILGATPLGRHIEQHDVFFGIAASLKDLVPEIKAFWTEANGKIHLDAWQELRFADGYEIQIVAREDFVPTPEKLFFINLGGYRPGEFLEHHEQHIMVGKSMAEVVKRVKQTDFYKTMGFPGAVSHIDDKHGVDIDDIFEISELLSDEMKQKYAIKLLKSENPTPNPTEIGYININKL